MRILALDVGETRIGIAMSDPVGLIATPISTLKRQNENTDIDEILRFVTEHNVGEIVVGLPISLSGRKGHQAQKTLSFTKVLDRKTKIPIVLVDERFSTVVAKRSLRELGVKPSQTKAHVDAAAAAVILQSHLESQRSNDP